MPARVQIMIPGMGFTCPRGFLYRSTLTTRSLLSRIQGRPLFLVHWRFNFVQHSSNHNNDLIMCFDVFLSVMSFLQDSISLVTSHPPRRHSGDIPAAIPSLRSCTCIEQKYYKRRRLSLPIKTFGVIPVDNNYTDKHTNTQPP